jgi:hypothetical protein
MQERERTRGLAHAVPTSGARVCCDACGRVHERAVVERFAPHVRGDRTAVRGALKRVAAG